MVTALAGNKADLDEKRKVTTEISCMRKDVKYGIQVQMVEIYNEQVRDLLTNEASPTKLEIRNCSYSGVSLRGADMHLVHSTSDVLDLMKLGGKNRVSGSTSMNQNSSRSHSVLIVHVHDRDVSGSMTRSCLHLMDLAGCERVDKSEATGDRLKEVQHINKSLPPSSNRVLQVPWKWSWRDYY